MMSFSSNLLPFPPSGGRWREAPDEGAVPLLDSLPQLAEAAPSSVSRHSSQACAGCASLAALRDPPSPARGEGELGLS